LHVLSNEDVPNFASSGPGITSYHTKQIYEVEETPNRKSINEPVSQRQCRFPSEHSIKGIPYRFVVRYVLSPCLLWTFFRSHSTCVGNRFSEMGMDKCDCSVFSYKDPSKLVTL